MTKELAYEVPFGVEPGIPTVNDHFYSRSTIIDAFAGKLAEGPIPVGFRDGVVVGHVSDPPGGDLKVRVVLQPGHPMVAAVVEAIELGAVVLPNGTGTLEDGNVRNYRLTDLTLAPKPAREDP